MLAGVTNQGGKMLKMARAFMGKFLPASHLPVMYSNGLRTTDESAFFRNGLEDFGFLALDREPASRQTRVGARRTGPRQFSIRTYKP